MATKIYILSEPNGRIRYVGRTIKTLNKRLLQHLSVSRCGKKGYLYNWIRSFLSKGFLPIIQLVGEVEGDGCKEEIAWIKYFRDEGVDLVNTTDGGEGALGCKVCCKGVGHYLFGKHIPPETRLKMSLARKGISYSAETIEKMSAAHKGKHLSAEHREKLSKALKGKNTWCTGKHHSMTTKQKMSKARKGKTCSTEARHNMSEAKKEWWRAKKIAQKR